MKRATGKDQEIHLIMRNFPLYKLLSHKYLNAHNPRLQVGLSREISKYDYVVWGILNPHLLHPN